MVVAELQLEDIEWNKGLLGECAGSPLNDKTVMVHKGDVAEPFTTKQASYDAVLLDVDNGHEDFTQVDNKKTIFN